MFPGKSIAVFSMSRRRRPTRSTASPPPPMTWQSPGGVCNQRGKRNPQGCRPLSFPRKVERFLEILLATVKDHAPQCLATYTNYPSTEFLLPRGLDFYAANVYLENTSRARRISRTTATGRRQIAAGARRISASIPSAMASGADRGPRRACPPGISPRVRRVIRLQLHG